VCKEIKAKEKAINLLYLSQGTSLSQPNCERHTTAIDEKVRSIEVSREKTNIDREDEKYRT
jgi:hypothetical protein